MQQNGNLQQKIQGSLTTNPWHDLRKLTSALTISAETSRCGKNFLEWQAGFSSPEGYGFHQIKS